MKYINTYAIYKYTHTYVCVCVRFGIPIFLQAEPLFTWLVVFPTLPWGQTHFSHLQSHVSLYTNPFMHNYSPKTVSHSCKDSLCT